MSRIHTCHDTGEAYVRGADLEIRMNDEVARVAAGESVFLGGYEITVHRAGEIVRLCGELGSECGYPMSTDLVVMQRVP